MIRGANSVAHFAHLGGFVAGFLCGFVLLQKKLILLSEFDNPTLPELIVSQNGSSWILASKFCLLHSVC
ncbi:MAG: hypothetical protein ACFBZ8_12925 [Opitutales bacterium]